MAKLGKRSGLELRCPLGLEGSIPSAPTDTTPIVARGHNGVNIEIAPQYRAHKEEEHEF